MQNINNDSQGRPYHLFCPVCRHNVLRDKFTVNDFPIVRCESCQLMFVKEKLSQPELDRYYEQAAERDCTYLSRENDENLKYYYRNLRSLILERVPSGKILDVGCSAGGFLDVMNDFECYGMERSPSFGKAAKEKYGDDIFIGTFEDYQAPNFLFDCVSLQDVLDHTVDPLAVLEKCRKLLKPNGLLIIKVHDFSCLYAKIMGKRFYAIVPPFHLFYFNKKAMAEILEKASFDILFSKHLSHLMFVGTIFFRLSRENQKSGFFRLYELINKTGLGHKKVRKNLHDIVTVFAVKK